MPRALFTRIFAALGACCIALALLAPAEARAQAGIAGQPIQVCVLRDTGGMNPAELIRHPERFDCTTPQRQFGAGDYWVISEDLGARPQPDPLVVRIASVWQKGLTFHALFADGRLVTQPTDARGVTPLIQLGAIVEHRIPREPSKLVRVMWHVSGAANARAIVLGARLATDSDSAHANLAMAAIYSAFAGLCIALICYNLALWGALRHRFQLYYCAMVAGLLLYAFSSSGALAWAWPEIANNDRLRINYLLLGFSGAGALVFARSFFEERVFAGWLGRLTSIAAGAMALSGVAFVLTAPFAVIVADLVFTGVFLAISGVMLPMLWRAWRRRSNYLWLFAIGWSAPILTAMLRALANLHVIPWNFWLDNSTILSMAVEALLSSLAIAYRIRLLSKERDEAILREVLARRLADVDPLTGLLNRRAFLEQAIGREGEQVLQIADLDHFKRVNDTLGHDGGDEVLRVFARMLRSVTPTGALVARIGGEEFAILAPADEAIEADVLLARLRATRMPFDLKVTASVGSCAGPIRSERDWKALYRGADRALFEAKSAGRDRSRDAERQAA